MRAAEISLHFPSMVELRQVSKRFGNFTAVDRVDLAINAGEFITLLGPSGCGKTTILRMISGLESPSAGEVFLDGQDVTRVPPHRRDVNQVFQSYALFPHLNVADNIAFGLRMKKIPRADRQKRVVDAIQMVELAGLEKRRPNELSGGQRQRVALARAIVNRPKVLLLDEPLAALDAKLRRAMQLELKQLQHRLKITFIFVTHDQEEALTMSDRIAVINQGKIEQLGSVAEIYHRPLTPFVAGFIGHANLFEAAVLDRPRGAGCVRIENTIELTTSFDLPTAGKAAISIRPEKLRIHKTRPAGENVIEATIEQELFRGPMNQLLLRTTSGLAITALLVNESTGTESLHCGQNIFAQVHRDDVVVVSSV